MLFNSTTYPSPVETVNTELPDSFPFIPLEAPEDMDAEGLARLTRRQKNAESAKRYPLNTSLICLDRE
jgi:hypothetical protein